jgi:F420-non-reducing hydrogenase small subunit
VEVPEGTLTIPAFWHTVKSLDQVVDVDYYLPGCPPEPPQIWAVLQVIVAGLLEGAPLPPKGSVVGHSGVAVCEECPLEKSEKVIARFYRPYEIVPEPGICLLEQGIVCMGPATVGGCGALCPQVGMGCRGCYGPLPGVADQGGKMLSALASVIGAGEAGMEEHEIERQIEAAVGTIPDPAGTFYRFSMAPSLLRRAKVEEGG